MNSPHQNWSEPARRLRARRFVMALLPLRLNTKGLALALRKGSFAVRGGIPSLPRLRLVQAG